MVERLDPERYFAYRWHPYAIDPGVDFSKEPTTLSGRERIWELEPKRLEKARRCLDQISDQWDVAVGRLKAFVEV